MKENSAALTSAVALSRRLMASGVIILVVTLILVPVAMFMPIQIADASTSPMTATAIRPLPRLGKELQPLLSRIVGEPLIKPAKVQAAVKDDGTAKKLLEKLKLQGVIEMGGELVAYVGYTEGNKTQTLTLKKGDPALDFVVENIEPGKVTLTLNGVTVVLSY